MTVGVRHVSDAVAPRLGSILQLTHNPKLTSSQCFDQRSRGRLGAPPAGGMQVGSWVPVRFRVGENRRAASAHWKLVLHCLGLWEGSRSYARTGSVQDCVPASSSSESRITTGCPGEVSGRAPCGFYSRSVSNSCQSNQSRQDAGKDICPTKPLDAAWSRSIQHG